MSNPFVLDPTQKGGNSGADTINRTASVTRTDTSGLKRPAPATGKYSPADDAKSSKLHRSDVQGPAGTDRTALLGAGVGMLKTCQDLMTHMDAAGFDRQALGRTIGPYLALMYLLSRVAQLPEWEAEILRIDLGKVADHAALSACIDTLLQQTKARLDRGEGPGDPPSDASQADLLNGLVGMIKVTEGDKQLWFAEFLPLLFQQGLLADEIVREHTPAIEAALRDPSAIAPLLDGLDQTVRDLRGRAAPGNALGGTSRNAAPPFPAQGMLARISVSPKTKADLEPIVAEIERDLRNTQAVRPLSNPEEKLLRSCVDYQSDAVADIRHVRKDLTDILLADPPEPSEFARELTRKIALKSSIPLRQQELIFHRLLQRPHPTTSQLNALFPFVSAATLRKYRNELAKVVATGVSRLDLTEIFRSEHGLRDPASFQRSLNKKGAEVLIDPGILGTLTGVRKGYKPPDNQPELTFEQALARNPKSLLPFIPAGPHAPSAYVLLTQHEHYVGTLADASILYENWKAHRAATAGMASAAPLITQPGD